MRSEIDDNICLLLPKKDGTLQKRHWGIIQPVPSVAFSLQGRLQAALGPGVYQGITRLLAVSEAHTDPLANDQGEGSLIQDAKSKTLTLGDSHALAVFRNARAGQSLVKDDEPLHLAADRLRHTVSLLANYFGVNLQASLLYGEATRLEDNMAHTWGKPSLLHQLLLSSELKFRGTGDKPLDPDGTELDESPGAKLFQAVNHGRVVEFVNELDNILVSPDELMMLCIWSLVHLLRPF